MLKATRRFFGRIRDVEKGLRFRVIDTTNLHGLKEDTLRLREDHFTSLGAVNGRNHFRGDFTRLTARDRAIRWIGKGEIRFNARNVARDARHLGVWERVDLDVFEGEDAERNIADFIPTGATRECNRRSKG